MAEPQSTACHQQPRLQLAVCGSVRQSVPGSVTRFLKTMNSTTIHDFSQLLSTSSFHPSHVPNILMPTLPSIPKSRASSFPSLLRSSNLPMICFAFVNSNPTSAFRHPFHHLSRRPSIFYHFLFSLLSCQSHCCILIDVE